MGKTHFDEILSGWAVDSESGREHRIYSFHSKNFCSIIFVSEDHSSASDYHINAFFFCIVGAPLPSVFYNQICNMFCSLNQQPLKGGLCRLLPISLYRLITTWIYHCNQLQNHELQTSSSRYNHSNYSINHYDYDRSCCSWTLTSFWYQQRHRVPLWRKITPMIEVPFCLYIYIYICFCSSSPFLLCCFCRPCTCRSWAREEGILYQSMGRNREGESWEQVGFDLNYIIHFGI